MQIKPYILLVDDNEDILDFISEELCEKYTILKAFNGQEAMEILQEEAVQLVVSDIMMEVMDGFELCRRIKTNFEYSHIPVILLTAKTLCNQRLKAWRWEPMPISKNIFT
jgi:CheY-like chemotaxis protein